MISHCPGPPEATQPRQKAKFITPGCTNVATESWLLREWHLLAEECLDYTLNYRRYDKELPHLPLPDPAQETNSETLTCYATNITSENIYNLMHSQALEIFSGTNEFTQREKLLLGK